MAKPIVSKKKAYTISLGLFLVCLGVLVFTNMWWPWILLALWIMVSSRFYLEGKILYAVISTFIFLGLFFTALLKFAHEMILPVLLVIAGIFLILREYYLVSNEEK
ncbi:MAG: hypothetical protein WB791_03280 [Waddliaceae bacterium]